MRGAESFVSALPCASFSSVFGLPHFLCASLPVFYLSRPALRRVCGAIMRSLVSGDVLALRQAMHIRTVTPAPYRTAASYAVCDFFRDLVFAGRDRLTDRMSGGPLFNQSTLTIISSAPTG